MKYLVLVVLGFCSVSAQAQFWFGPKIGVQQTNFVYQEPKYKQDTVSVGDDQGFQFGGIFVYQGTEKYAAQVELLWERIQKTVTNLPTSEVPIYSFTQYEFLSLPLSLRYNFGNEPIHYYIAGGPKLSLWMSGKGSLYLDELNEAKTLDGPIDYKFVFRESKGGDFNRRTVIDANRLQYSLQVSTGMYFDLQFGGRLLLDLRYSFGHSNMAFNKSAEFKYDSYYENLEFRNNTLSANIAYIFGYDAAAAKKGLSTIEDSRDVKKRKDKKKHARLFQKSKK